MNKGGWFPNSPDSAAVYACDWIGRDAARKIVPKGRKTLGRSRRAGPTAQCSKRCSCPRWPIPRRLERSAGPLSVFRGERWDRRTGRSCALSRSTRCQPACN